MTTVRELQYAAGNIIDTRDAITEAERMLYAAHQEHSKAHMEFSRIRDASSEDVKVAYNRVRRHGDPIA